MSQCSFTNPRTSMWAGNNITHLHVSRQLTCTPHTSQCHNAASQFHAPLCEQACLRVSRVAGRFLLVHHICPNAISHTSCTRAQTHHTHAHTHVLTQAHTHTHAHTDRHGHVPHVHTHTHTHTHWQAWSCTTCTRTLGFKWSSPFTAQTNCCWRCGTSTKTTYCEYQAQKQRIVSIKHKLLLALWHKHKNNVLWVSSTKTTYCEYQAQTAAGPVAQAQKQRIVSIKHHDGCTHTHIHTHTHTHTHHALSSSRVVLVHYQGWPKPYICTVYVGLARTVFVHRIWPYIWWFPCQKYRVYTVYTCKCMVLANSTELIVRVGQNRICALYIPINLWFWPTLFITHNLIELGLLLALWHESSVGQNHTYTVHIRYFWQGNHQIYGHIRCIYTVLAYPSQEHKITWLEPQHYE